MIIVICVCFRLASCSLTCQYARVFETRTTSILPYCLHTGGEEVATAVLCETPCSAHKQLK